MGSIASYSVDFGCVHVYLCAGRDQRLTLNVLLDSSLPYSVETKCLSEPGADCLGWTGCSASPRDRPFAASSAHIFYVGAGMQNQVLMLISRALPVELCP